MRRENHHSGTDLQDLVDLTSNARSQAQTALQTLADTLGPLDVDQIREHLKAEYLLRIIQLTPLKLSIESMQDPSQLNHLDSSEEEIRRAVNLDTQESSLRAIDFYKLQGKNFMQQYHQDLMRGNPRSAQQNYRFAHACDKAAIILELHAQTLAT